MELENLSNIKHLTDFDPNGLNKLYKLNIANKFMNAKAANPGLTQDQLCKMIGTSSSTMKRVRTDLNLTSPYRYDVPLKHKQKKETKTKTETEIVEKQTITSKPTRGRPKKKESNKEITDEELNKVLDT